MNTQTTKNADGFTSEYGFACGYTENRETDVISLQLWKEHNTYHVRLNNFQQGTDEEAVIRNDWQSFEKLSEAKELFFTYCQKFNLKKIK